MVRASEMLRGSKAVGVLVAVITLHESLCSELQFLQRSLSWLALGVTNIDTASP